MSFVVKSVVVRLVWAVLMPWVALLAGVGVAWVIDCLDRLGALSR